MISHVAFVVNNYPPHLGGVERHVSQLATELVKLGARATVITLGEEDSDTVEEGVRVVRLPRGWGVGDVLSFPSPRTVRRVERLLREARPTAISTHTRFFPMSWVGLRAGAALGIPVVHTEHGSAFVRGVSAPIAIASRLVDLTLGRWMLRRSDMVLAVSDGVAAFVRRLAGVDARVFHNAVDLTVWRDTARAPRAAIAFVGRLVPGKGWPEFLEVAERLGEHGVAATAEIFGDGPGRADLAAALASRGLGDRVQARGQVAAAELARALSGAVLVNPSTLAEGFQTSLIESVCAGGRVVTYEVGGARLLADDGAPVTVAARSVDALTAAVERELARPSAPYPEARRRRWGWPSRAAEYLRIAEEAVGERRLPAT